MGISGGTKIVNRKLAMQMSEREKLESEIFRLKAIINSLLFALDNGEYEGLEDNIKMAREAIGNA